MSTGPGLSSRESLSLREPYSVRWEYLKSHSLPSMTTPMICRGNAISYACLNTIRTWNYKSDEEKVRFFAMDRDEKITALAELSRRELIWGNNRGYIFVENLQSRYKFRAGSSAVDEILILGPGYIIVKFNDKTKALVAVESGRTLKHFDSETEVCRYRENTFASVCGKNIEVVEVDAPGKVWRWDNHFRREFSAIRVERDERLKIFILLKHADQRGFTIWSAKENIFTEAPLDRIWTDQFKVLVFINIETYFIPKFNSETKGMLLAKYTFDARKQSYRFRAGPEAGHGKVLCMILRKDPNPAPGPRDPEDFIVYGTSRLEAFPSGVHIFNMNCELVHSFDCTNYSDPLALVKLKDGSFAVKLFDSVSILKKRSNFRNYKSRLFVGEADFSFTKALVKKHKGNHPDLPRAIVATELSPEADKCRKELKFEGVETHIGIDAQELHNHAKRFKRIHWNCPYREDLTDRNFDFPRVFRNFFESCSKIQRPGDRVHVTLMQERRDDRWKKFRQQECPVVSGSAYAGYRLVRKRIFGEGRYPGYGHWKSGGKSMHSANDEDMREFVFEKVDFGVEYPAGKRHAVKKYRPSDTEYYFECSTDSDSSSYEDSSSEEDTDAKVGYEGERFSYQHLDPVIIRSNIRVMSDSSFLAPLTPGYRSVPPSGYRAPMGSDSSLTRSSIPGSCDVPSSDARSGMGPGSGPSQPSTSGSWSCPPSSIGPDFSRILPSTSGSGDIPPSDFLAEIEPGSSSARSSTPGGSIFSSSDFRSGIGPGSNSVRSSTPGGSNIPSPGFRSGIGPGSNSARSSTPGGSNFSSSDFRSGIGPGSNSARSSTPGGSNIPSSGFRSGIGPGSGIFQPSTPESGNVDFGPSISGTETRPDSRLTSGPRNFLSSGLRAQMGNPRRQLQYRSGRIWSERNIGASYPQRGPCRRNENTGRTKEIVLIDLS